MVGKEEYQKELLAVQNVEKAIVDNQNVLLGLLKQQDEFKENYKGNSEQMYYLMKEAFEELQNKEKTHANEIANVTSMIEKTITTLHTKNNSILNLLEQLHADDDEIKNIAEKAMLQMQDISNVISDGIKQINQNIIQINQIPCMVDESIKDLVSEFGNMLENMEEKMEYLQEDIRDEEKSRTKKFNSIITEIAGSTEACNEDMTKEIKKLSDQYDQFEKVISGIVNQMNNIAKEDIEVLKGFLNK